MKRGFLLIFWLFTSLYTYAAYDADSIVLIFEKGNYIESRRFYEDEKIRVKKEGKEETKEYADVIFKIGYISYRLGDFRGAFDNYKKAYMLRKKLLGVKHPDFVQSIYRFAELFYEFGKYDIAEKIYTKALELTAQVHGRNDIHYAQVLDKIGRLRVLKSDFESAETYFQKSADIYKDIVGEIHPLYATNLAGQGFLYSENGYYTAAEALFRQAKFIYKKQLSESHPHYLEMLFDLSDLLLKLNNYEKSAEILRHLIEVQEEIGGKQSLDYAKYRYTLGKVYLHAGYPNEARPLIEESILSFKSKLGRKHVLYYQAKSQLADINKYDREFETSENTLVSSLDTLAEVIGERNMTYSEMETELADLYYAMGNYDDAVGLHQRALEIRKELLEDSHPDYMQSFSELALINWARGNYSVADKYFNKSIDNYYQQFNRYFAFLSEEEKGLFYKKIKVFFDKFNSFSLSYYSKDRKFILEDMYDNQIATKALLFHTTTEIRKQIVMGRDKDLLTKYNNWISLKEQLAKLYKLEASEIENRHIPLDSLEEKANALEKELSLRVELSDKEAEGIENYTWKEIRAELGPNEAAIEIIRFQEFLPDSGGAFTEKIYYAALIVTENTKRHPEIVILDNGVELENKYINYYQNAIRHQVDDDISYDMFWKPIISSHVLENIKKIYLSIDGVYNKVSLATLQNPITGKYVLDETEMHFLTNTKDIAKLGQAGDDEVSFSNDDMILIGFPDYYFKSGSKTIKTVSNDKEKGKKKNKIRTRGGVKNLFRGGKIDDLPGTKEEIEAIYDLFNENEVKVKIFLRAAAAEKELKNVKSPKLLHIATHGFFLSDVQEKNKEKEFVLTSTNRNPLMLSGIMLSGAGHAYSDETLLKEIDAIVEGRKHEDGILTAYEAMNLDLSNTELVVLSACETGLGVVKNGEGVYGLQRALQTAGAKSLIMSLWKVNDEATKQLMIYFYDEWLKTNNKREAFKLAQHKLREQFPDPIYWGAFIMIGE